MDNATVIVETLQALGTPVLALLVWISFKALSIINDIDKRLIAVEISLKVRGEISKCPLLEPTKNEHI